MHAQFGPTRLQTLEHASFRTQVKLFAGTRVLVAQHGAALTNMLWMPTGGVIVEIVPRGMIEPFGAYFRDLAALCGHRYAMVPQEGIHAPVDPADLLQALADAG